MNSSPASLDRPFRPLAGRVVEPGAFHFAAAFLDHGHINSQCQGLVEAGGTLKWVYDADPAKVAAFCQRFPGTKGARSFDEILADDAVKLVAAAAITCERGPIGCRVMQAGKDYFTDKAPFTTLEQLAQARRIAEETRRKYMVYYAERLHVESAMHAGDLVEAGVIGRVVQVVGLGPHRLNLPSRPAWFFKRAQYGGILCDIGSHQVEQFLHYSGSTDATVLDASVGNYANPEHPELEDFGQATLQGSSGATNYLRVDWMTPAGLSNWGDGRTVILGTKGYIELRKYLDVGREREGDQLYVVDGQGEHHLRMRGRVGFRYFGDLILDCLNRTENAMTQVHAFKAAEICLKAQQQARNLTPQVLR